MAPRWTLKFYNVQNFNETRVIPKGGVFYATQVNFKGLHTQKKGAFHQQYLVWSRVTLTACPIKAYGIKFQNITLKEVSTYMLFSATNPNHHKMNNSACSKSCYLYAIMKQSKDASRLGCHINITHSACLVQLLRSVCHFCMGILQLLYLTESKVCTCHFANFFALNQSLTVTVVVFKKKYSGIQIQTDFKESGQR